MALIKAGSIEINVREWGAGEPLLLVHGLGTNSSLWCHQLRPFAARQRVLAVDLRGFGRSSKPRERAQYSIDIMADDIAAVCEALALPPIHYLGVSMGGFIGQALALRHPTRVRSLILGHSAAEFAIPAEVMESRLQALASVSMDEYAKLVAAQALAQPPDAIVDEWLREMIAGNDREAYRHVLAGALAAFDVTQRLRDIDRPALVICGSDDRVIPPDKGAALARGLRGAAHAVIDGVGHIGYAEKPEAFNRLVLDFLGSLARA
jgi:3-oxoadipate enol-lactonase